MKKNIYFTPFGKRSITIMAIFFLIAGVGGWYGATLHKEVVAIQADDGYYAVSEKINQFGFPEVVRKPLE